MELNNKTVRIVSAVIVIASILWGWWWLTWVLAIILLFVFPSYYEIIFFGVMYDALYGLPLAQFSYFPYVFTVSSVVLFFVSSGLRKSLLAYENKL